MKELSLKFLSSASIAIMILTISSCSYKSDHPQKNQSFSERRDPKENSLALSGMLGSKKNQKVKVDYSNSNPTSQSTSTAPQTSSDKQSSDKAPASESSFFQRLFNIGKSSNEQQSKADTMNFAYNVKLTRKPIENDFELARSASDQFSAQGSSQANSHFDMAEPVSSAPIQNVKESKLNTINVSSAIINNAHAEEPAKMPALPQPVTSEKPAAPKLPELDLPTTSAVSAANTNPAPVVEQNKQAPAKEVVPVPAMPQNLNMDNKDVSKQLSPTTNAPQPPMVKVPELPADKQMKEETKSQPAPQLNTVPAVPANPQMPVTTNVQPTTTATPDQPAGHVVQPHVGHPIVQQSEQPASSTYSSQPVQPAQPSNTNVEHKAPEPHLQQNLENHQVITDANPKAENAEIKVKKKKVKKAIKKPAAVKPEPNPVDFESIKTLDNSQIVNDKGHYIATKFLGEK